MDTGSEKDLFFHSSSLDGVSYEELQEGQRVAYNEEHVPRTSSRSDEVERNIRFQIGRSRYG